MHRDVDGAYVAAQIRLTRQVHKGTILLLEGETDAKVFNSFIDHSLCEIEISFGKQNALDALDFLEDEGFSGVVALVDADFDRILKRTYPLENLFITDQHDLDLTIFTSSAFDRYIAEHADESLLKKHFNNDLQLLRDTLVRASLPLSCCRLVSERRDLNLIFKKLKHDDFVHRETLSINQDTVVSEVLLCSRIRCTLVEMNRYIEIEVAKNHDLYQLANGHDVSAILGIALRKLLACRREAQTWASEIEAGLRLTFGWEALRSTGLYRCLCTWEVENKPYRIFRRPT